MGEYLTYDSYIELGGTLDEAMFNRYAFRAENAINYRTFDRLLKLDISEQSERLQKALKLIMFDLISLYVASDSYNGLISSSTTTSSDNNIPEVRLLGQSNDGVTVTYNVASAKDATVTIEKQINDAIELGLSGLSVIIDGVNRKLLYRGLYPGE